MSNGYELDPALTNPALTNPALTNPALTNPALTKAQRQLVQENLGLVGVHLCRYVPGAARTTRDRERDDLFQEGCLGLVQAAIQFDASRGIPFAAYALPRIHNAVTRALHRRFSCVYVPPRRTRPQDDRPDERADPGQPPSTRPKVYSLSEEQEANLRSRERRHDPNEPTETVGSRLREKYDRAVCAAAVRLSVKTGVRGDRDKLVRALVEQRYRMPDETRRTPIRQIARETRSSFARVQGCNEQIRKTIQRRLEADPEFGALVAKQSAIGWGVDLPIDASFEEELRLASTAEFLRRFRDAPVTMQGRWLAAFLEISGTDIGDLVHRAVAHLSPLRREDLLTRVWGDRWDTGRGRAHSKRK